MEKEKQPFVVVSAKVPPEVRKLIEETAEKEDRSISQVTSRLLSSHPLLEPKLKGSEQIVLDK